MNASLPRLAALRAPAARARLESILIHQHFIDLSAMLAQFRMVCIAEIAEMWQALGLSGHYMGVLRALRGEGKPGVLVVAPGWALRDLAQHAGWLATPVIWATKGCAALAGVLLLFAWFRAAGLRCILAALTALVFVIEVRAVIAGHYFGPRPFAAITAEAAFGCVYVGVHYATDVLAGAPIGAACGPVLRPG
jgi:hypothetical protein